MFLVEDLNFNPLTRSGLMSMVSLIAVFHCVPQLEKWDGQRDDGTFPGKI